MIYSISTGILCLFLTASAGSYVFHKPTIDGVRALGFPDFFRIELAALKILAVLVLLVPGTPSFVKEWAYAGIALFLLTAVVAHFAHRDPVWLNMINLFMFAMLALSWFNRAG